MTSLVCGVRHVSDYFTGIWVCQSDDLVDFSGTWRSMSDLLDDITGTW